MQTSPAEKRAHPLSPQGKAIACLLGAALLWSTGGVLIKWVSWNGLAICGARSAIAALFLLLVVRKPKFDWSLAQIGGAVAYASTVLLYVSAVKMTTAANAILLQYTSPVWVALFGAWFLGERTTRRDWLTLVVSCVGMVLFFAQGLASKSLVGDLLAAASGVTIAWQALFLRKQKRGAPLESVILGNLLAAAVGLPFGWGSWPTAQGWATLAVLGVFQLGLSYLLFTTAIRQVTALEAMLFSTLEPILNPVWAALLLHEWPTPLATLGGALVLAAVTARGALLALRPRLGEQKEPARAGLGVGTEEPANLDLPLSG
jgi:drug/metabolite transporter (DMT)-like permease